MSDIDGALVVGEGALDVAAELLGRVDARDLGKEVIGMLKADGASLDVVVVGAVHLVAHGVWLVNRCQVIVCLEESDHC